MNYRVFRDHPVGMRRRNRMRLGRGRGRGRRRARTRMTQGTMMLGMARAVDLTDQTNIPLIVDVDMP